MKVTELLVKEHDLIRMFLAIQWESVKKLKEDIRPSRQFFEQSIKFIRTFADKFHHIKEEEIMFRHLAGKKSGDLDAKIEMLKQQHERGRDHVVQISDSLDQYEKGTEIATENVIINLASFYSLLSRHIHIEDHYVYPLIEEVFTDEEKAALLEEFRKAEERTGSDDFFEENRKLVGELGTLIGA